jgi:hypothetical protein
MDINKKCKSKTHLKNHYQKINRLSHNQEIVLNLVYLKNL